MGFSNHQIAYLQITDQVYESLLPQQRSQSERIPSMREMASNITANPNTVACLWMLDRQNA